MLILHLSDLHIGKSVNEISMLEEQKNILEQILNLTEECNVDAVIIAGDVYDRSIPPVEAVKLFDDFLYRLGETGKQIFIIGGNHDSAERVSFAGRLLEKLNIHIYSLYDGTVHSYEMKDEYGTVHFFLMPFVKPSAVRVYFDNETIQSYDDAFKTALSEVDLDEKARNVMVAHQYVTNGGEIPLRCASEQETIGGLDNIDVSVFDGFDYVALGHLHRSQKVKRETVRYCGSPLKYSASEVNGKKTALLVNLKEKGIVKIEKKELVPLHGMRKIEGKLEALLADAQKEDTSLRDDYIFAVLTDETELLEPVARLRSVYKNLMGVEYRRIRSEEQQDFSAEERESMSPIELLEKFYQLQNGTPLDEIQAEAVKNLFEELTRQAEE